MSCKICHLPIICVIGHDAIKAKYIKLFKAIFPKKPIELRYCASCYQSLVDELDIEIKSQQEHINTYKEELELLKAKCKQDYSIMDHNVNTDNKQKRYIILDENSEEYRRIYEHFSGTLFYKIIRIEKSNNPVLLQKFNERSKQLTCQNIKYLFHGSADKAYENILETGFDLHYANASGLLGAGIYFAEDASYSHGFGRITNTNLGKINHILYCRVNLGKTCKGCSGMTSTPKGFDAVHSDHKTYAVFDNYQGLPEYIIYYLVEDHK